MFLHVLGAKHLHDHWIRLWFSDGFEGDVDLGKALDGPVFEPLKNVEYFACFKIDGHTIAWENGADFAPEYLRGVAEAAQRGQSSHAPEPPMRAS